MYPGIVDPPAYWREQLRKLLSAGGDPAVLDPFLELSGPPDVFLNGISTDERSVRVRKAIPAFNAHSWRTRMWTCVRVELGTVPANDSQAKLIPTKSEQKSVECTHCGAQTTVKVPGKARASIVTDSSLITFQRRFRLATDALGLAHVASGIHLYMRPGKAQSLVAWRPLDAPYEITTDPRMDLDNLLKAIGDALQGKKGTPGLLYNDRIIQLVTVGRTIAIQPQVKGP